MTDQKLTISITKIISLTNSNRILNEFYCTVVTKLHHDAHTCTVGKSWRVDVIGCLHSMQSAVLLHVRPSVRLSVTLRYCDHVGWNDSEEMHRQQH